MRCSRCCRVLFEAGTHRQNQQHIEKPIEDGLLSGGRSAQLARQHGDDIVQGITGGGAQGQDRGQGPDRDVADVTSESICATQEYRRIPEIGVLVVGVEFAEAFR